MAPITKVRKAAAELRNRMSYEASQLTIQMNDHSSSGSSSSESTLDQDHSGKQFARVNRMVLDKESDEYKKRRERNNLAVKKSRHKSKLKTIQTMERVEQLKKENESLQQKIDILSKELRLLKDLFMAHASHAHGTQLTDVDLSFLTNHTDRETEFQRVPSKIQIKYEDSDHENDEDTN